MTRIFADIASTYRAALPENDITLLRIEGLDRTGVPVTQVNYAPPGKTITTGHGYGASTDEADVGALGELCEEVFCGAAIARLPQTTASFSEIVRTRGAQAAVDPLTLCLPAGSGYDADRTLHWVQATAWPERTPILVPADWVAAHSYQLGHPPDLITPITNGLGAGLDLAHAVGHGVMELLQRDGNVTGYRALDQGIVVDLDAVEDPETSALLRRLSALGIDVTVKLAGTEFGITNLYVVGDDRGDPRTALQVTACGEAAHPDRERALRKALLEFCGSRARKAATHGAIDVVRPVMGDARVDALIAAARPDEEEERALLAMSEWLDQDAATLRARLAPTVFSRRSTVPFSDLPTIGARAAPSSSGRLAWLTDRLALSGLRILVVDCSPPDSPVHAVKVIVPGLESETMSYGRIGWRGVQRLRSRDDPLIGDRPVEGAKRVLLRPDDEARAGGPAWFDAALADRIVGPLYPLYREPGCFSAQLHRARTAVPAA